MLADACLLRKAEIFGDIALSFLPLFLYNSPMQEISGLLEKGEYVKVIELTENCSEPREIFARISSFIGLGENERALKTLLSYRQPLFSSRPVMAIKANMELRFALHQFEEAYEDLEFYKNMPYVSQKVEEALKDLPKLIRNEEKAYLLAGSAKTNDVGATLLSKDPYAVLGALSEIGKKRLPGYEGKIENILLSPFPSDVKAFALEVLASLGYQKKVKFRDGQETLEVVPSKLISPFEEETYVNLRQELAKGKDASLSGIALKILDSLALVSFPRYPFKGRDVAISAKALEGMAACYLGQNPSLEGEAKKEKERLDSILAKHPPLA